MSDKALSKFEKLIAILRQELELTGTEVADILWLAKQRQTKVEKTSISARKNVTYDTSSAPTAPEQTTKAKNKPNQPVSNSNPGAPTAPTAPKQPVQVGVYTKSTSSKSLAIKLPDAPGLPQPLKLARALRPLNQKINSGTEIILDEEATANRIAEERVNAPVFQPALEPAFDLILVVDESSTMIFWQKTIQELRKLLEIQGAFRDVQIWGLLTNEEGDIYLRRGTGKTARKHRHYQPRFLVDPSGKRLFLVASDCVADIWHNGKAFSMLKIWAPTNIVAIIQMLPQWLWQRTALSLGAKVQFASLTPRIANQNLLIKKILLWSDVDFATGTKIPIFTLEENSAKTWSKMIAGKSGASVTGFVLPSNFTPPKEKPQTLQPEEIVSNFRRTATPIARKLASLLSAAPVITLPIVRIIQAQMLKEPQQVHVAEVFLGGILKRKEEITPETNPDEIEFDFVNEDIRTNFLQAAPITESLEIIDTISQYIANKINKTPTEFNALLRKPEEALTKSVDVKPFALLTAKVLKRLGGNYIQFAEEMEQVWDNLEQFPLISSVVINLGYGNLSEGFPAVTVGLRSANNPLSQQFTGSLAPAPNLIESYRNWRLTYQGLCDRAAPISRNSRYESTLTISFEDDDDDDLEIDEADIENVSIVDFYDFCQHLQLGINNWLLSPGIINISRQVRAALNPEEEIRVIIETQDIQIQKLPWQCSSFFQDYPRAEVSFARTEYKRTSHLQLPITPRNKVRILAILGNSQGINLEQEQKFLQSLPDAEVELIVKPTRQEFNDKLWDSQGWDMLFFAEHSQTESEEGIIYINENPTNNSLTIEQLTEALKAAIERGLKLAIFNSCDGLGLARSLEKLNLPTTIVMREPVANRVAEEFFNYFLQAFAFAQQSLYISVQQARRRLQGLEDDFPGASWLPVIFINPAEEPPTWVSLKEKSPKQVENKNKRQDWADAVDVSAFYGRNDEIDRLQQWIVNDNCRLITIIGMGGIGKTALSVKLASSVENKFDCIIWRSLRNAPSVEELLTDLIGFLATEDKIIIANSLDQQILQLIDCLRASRCLVVLDNFESILDGDKVEYREGYTGYGQLLRCVGETLHQSCVLVTSREKPKGLNAKQGENLPVRALTLKGLTYSEGELILKQKGLSPSATEINSLVECYAGNPLALKIAATTIIELFAGSISECLEVGAILYNDIFDLLDQQFQRLSMLERQVMYWLAINREWVSIKELQSDIIDTIKPRDLMRNLLAALESLQSRGLIENQAGKFTQQPVVMEYVTEELIEQVTQEIYTGEIHILNKYALLKAQTQDYLRNAQIQFILQPIADKLLDILVTKVNIQTHLNQILAQLKSSALPKGGYAAGNIINLLRQLDIELNTDRNRPNGNG